MTLPPLAPPDRRVVGGVCGGLAEAVGVDPTLVRLMFTLLALAGGAGVVLYVAAYLGMRSARRDSKVWPVVLLVIAVSVALKAFGLSGHMVVALALIAGGLALILRRGGSLRPDAPFSLAGAVLVALGTAILLLRGGTSGGLLAPGAVGAALLLVGGPWLWQLGVERDAERTARIRTEEREEVAARVHDSVLQSLALIQKHAEEPKRVASLARRQERELRDWLYGHGAATGEDTLVSALTASAADVEDLHGVRIDLATTGDVPLDDDVRAVVLAAREAMANAAKFSGADEISVFAEADDARVAVYVRDRGSGFDRAAVAADRRGIAESIEGRMARVGGTALLTTAPGEGTEVELTLPRGAS